MTEQRPTIFLYTDAAEIDARTKKAMVAAGFLPVKVATLDAVKFLEPSASPITAAELSALQRAMLRLLKANPASTIAVEFGAAFATELLSDETA